MFSRHRRDNRLLVFRSIISRRAWDLNSGTEILTGKIDRGRRAYFTLRYRFAEENNKATYGEDQLSGSRSSSNSSSSSSGTASGIVPRAIGIEFIAAAYFRQLKGIFIRARANLSRTAFYRLCSIGHS